MSEGNKILVVASANMDMLLRVKRMPKTGECLEENVYKYVPGGIGVNVALFLKKMNYEPVLCARVGNDANGKWLTEVLRKRGLDTRFIQSSPSTATGVNITMAPESEPNRSILFNNANQKLTPDDVNEATYSYPNSVFLQLSMPKDAVDTTISYAQRNKLPLFIYTSAKPKMYDIKKIEGCEVFITNQEAVNLFTGITDFKYDRMVQIGVELSHFFSANYYVIKLNNGNTLIYNNTSVKLHTPPVQVVAYDPLTSFDAFAAAVTAEFLSSRDIERASRFGGIVEAMTKMGEGSSKSLPKDFAEIRRFIFDNEIAYDL